jgi:hypothetical protein
LNPSKRKAGVQHNEEKRNEAHGYSSPPSRSSCRNSNSNSSLHQGQYPSFDSVHSPATNKSNSQKSENLKFMPTNNEKLYPSKRKALQHTEEKRKEALGYSSPPSISSSKNSNSNSSHHQGQYPSFDSVHSFATNKSTSKKGENSKFMPINSEKLHPSKRKAEFQYTEEKQKEAHGYSSPPSRSSSRNSNNISSYHLGQYTSFNSAHTSGSNKSNSQRSTNMCTPEDKVALQHNDEKPKKIHDFSTPHFGNNSQSRNSNGNNHEGKCLSVESVLTQGSENSTPKQSKKLYPTKFKKDFSHSDAKPNKTEGISSSVFEHRVKNKLSASHRHRGYPTSDEKSAANRRENSRRSELETEILKTTADPKISLKSSSRENGKQDKETSQVEKEFYISKRTLEKGSSKDAPG